MYRLPSFLDQTTYGSGAYGSQAYGAETTASTESTSGDLADTGMPIILGGTLGTALILCALILFKRSRRKDQTK